MRISAFIVFFLSIIYSCSAKNDLLSDFPQGYTPQDVGSKLSQHFISSKHMLHDGKWIHYAEICTWLGALRYAESANDSLLVKQLEERFAPFFSTEKHLLPIMNHVDLNMFGCLPLEFYKITGDHKYIDLGLPYADTQWNLPENPTAEETAFANKGLSWQTRFWIDDMYMINIVQSQAYRATSDRKYIDRAAKEMVVYLEKLQCSNGLFYHAPDAPFYWARGNGWMAAGMTELLRYLPHDNENYDKILNGYRLMMQNLKLYQNAEGLWNQLVDESDFWTETSGSAMFAYAIISGVKEGWLNRDQYAPVARRAWIALVPYINKDGDVTEVCIGTNKANDKEYYYKRPRRAGDYHGQAPYLWCAYALLQAPKADF
ncbi:MAG: glycoside hydrolase family 105 protein [Dysgonomonas sp.]